MKTIGIVCGLLVSSLAAVGCDEALAPSDGALPCGQGELVVVQAHSYCLFEASVVIETGFNCPEGTLPAEHEQKFICAPPDGLADEALSELSEALDAMSTRLDRPDPVKPMGNAGQAAMAQDERAADGADEEAASSVEELQTLEAILAVSDIEGCGRIAQAALEAYINKAEAAPATP